MVVCAGEGLEEELEPYIKLAPGVGYYRHTDLGGSPPRHHLFLDPGCAWHERGNDDDGETDQSDGRVLKLGFLHLVGQF